MNLRHPGLISRFPQVGPIEGFSLVARFAKEWFDKHKMQTKSDISRKEAKNFLGYAVASKLTGELRRREARRGA